MKRFFATVLALAVLALGSGARLLAHEGHEHKVMGWDMEDLASLRGDLDVQ